jgi:hypothetical protein
VSREDLLWVRHFETIEELRQALLASREVYNTTWANREAVRDVLGEAAKGSAHTLSDRFQCLEAGCPRDGCQHIRR